MKAEIKLYTALAGVAIGLLNTPLWLTLFMLVPITGLLADTFLKAAIYFKRKQARYKRLCHIYKRRYKHSNWPDEKEELPMLQFKEWKWWKQ